MGIMFAASFLLAPRRRSQDKALPYECGIQPAPYSWSQIHVRYYVFGIFFLIFDVEANERASGLVDDLPDMVPVGWYLILMAGAGFALWWRYQRIRL